MNKLAAIILLMPLAAAVGLADTGTAKKVTGLTAAVYDAALGSSMPGLVSEIHVKDGTSVRKGDVLLEFESTTEELEVDRRKLIRDDKTQLEAAKQSLAVVQKDALATRKLFEESRSIREDELEKKELELKLAEAQVKQAQLAEQREDLEYRMAVAQREHRRVTAPVDGVIISTYVEKGEYAQQHQPLVRLVNTDQCYLTCNVLAELSYRFKQGQKMSIQCESSDGPRDVEGEVIFISPLVDSASGLKEIRLQFENRDGAISPGVKGVITLK